MKEKIEKSYNKKITFDQKFILEHNIFMKAGNFLTNKLTLVNVV